MKTGNINDLIFYDRIKKQQLYKDERFTVMMLCMKEDEFLKPHYSNADAFLVVLEGTVIFIIDEVETVLEKGDMFTFKSTEQHSVKALKDSTLLIVK